MPKDAQKIQVTQVKRSEIEEEGMGCIYCMTIKPCDSLGCCGESSGHFQNILGVKNNSEYLVADDVEILEDE